jgi:hypothetical protein
MGAGYKLVPLAQAQPGMVLSNELLGPAGQVLLPKGAILTPATLTALARHGVGMIAVASGEQPGPPDPAQLGARLDQLFRGHDGSGAAAQLRRYVEQYRLATEAP